MNDAFHDLAAAADWYERWLAEAALPLWAKAGQDPANGGFREGLTLQGAPHDPRRRTRVQARQAYVYATAAREGFDGPWLPAATRGFRFLWEHGRRSDGLYADVLSPAGEILDETAHLYEQAFVLLALNALQGVDPRGGWAAEAAALRARLEDFRHPAGGFREVGPRPFQANAQMHLFETALAWGWDELADELAELALARFIDPATGVLREFFDEGWNAITGEEGLVEPGHQFEWAWLLERWGRLRGDDRGRQAARRLFTAGMRGVDAARGVATNALWDDLSMRDAEARLWPQTEWLKAALILGEDAHALSAARGLALYLDVALRGAWRDRMRADGSFLDEPAPASSFYHLLVAIQELRSAMREVRS